MSKDDIGERGQAMFVVVMTELCGRSEPYFRPRFLGDKFPTFDYLLELVDYPRYFFFVQVKTTTKGFTLDPPKLKIQVSQTDIDRMVAWQAPTYVVGIDEPSQTGYLLSVNEPRDHVPSLISTFKIDCTVLSQLATEVSTVLDQPKHAAGWVEVQGIGVVQWQTIAIGSSQSEARHWRPSCLRRGQT